jgi:hypothetical protein
MESSDSSSAYLHLFSEEVIGVTAEWNLFGYMCQYYSLYGVIEGPPDEACITVQWRGVTLKLTLATSNDYVSIVHRCCELSSDRRR